MLKAVYLTPLTYAQLSLMVNMQDKCNQVLIAPDYLDNPNIDINFRLAAEKEFYESLDHVDWKWWKAGSNNVTQIAIEMVDVIHFVISDALRLSSDRKIPSSRYLESYAKATEAFPELFNKQIDAMNADLVSGEITETQLLTGVIAAQTEEFVSGNVVDRLVIAQSIACVLGFDKEAVFNMYVAKNALNIFRATHGYKDGTYIKNWFGLEDNVEIQKYVESHDMTADSAFENLMAHLEAQYSLVKSSSASQS